MIERKGKDGIRGAKGGRRKLELVIFNKFLAFMQKTGSFREVNRVLRIVIHAILKNQ